MSLLAEHEVTRLISITRRIADKVGVQLQDGAELDELERDIAPEQVLDSLEKQAQP